MKATRSIPALIALTLGMSAATEVSAKTTLRIATLAPKASSWGKVVKVWRKAVIKKSGGALDLKVFYNAVQGRENAMVGKMKAGQLDGALLSTQGLSAINPDVRALALPGLILDWNSLEKVRKALTPAFKKAYEEKGYILYGWSDAGLMRGFSKGVKATKPSQLSGKRVVLFNDDAMSAQANSLIPGLVSVPLDPFETLPQIRSGNVNYVTVPAIAAEQLQWTPHLQYTYDRISGAATGGTLFKKAPLDALPADVRAGFMSIATRLIPYNTKNNRAEDDASFRRIAKKLEVVKISGADKAAWEAHDKKALKKIAQGTMPRALVSKVAKLVGKSL
ncbi:MAG: TRAP transporter substrate-binding protein DctP [Polyangiaceae bacterium]|nr:TRAP transporter substrate-binding protein DctP [Polyangiaceae bacterium]